MSHLRFLQEPRRKTSNLREPLIKLKRPRPEKEVHNAAFVGLEPVELDGLERADVEAVDVNRICQSTLELGVFGDRGADQGRADVVEHLLLRAFDHGAEGK